MAEDATSREQRFDNHYHFESHGVQISFETSAPEAIDALKKVVSEHLPGGVETDKRDTPHRFKLYWDETSGDSLYKGDEIVFESANRQLSLDQISSKIRLTVAEFTDSWVFVHSGVVGWKGKAIVIPGRSFTGKTALTTELVKRGAEYYSDEYAVFDEKGLVHPFPKTLSIRGEIDPYTQIEYPVEALGGRVGNVPLRVGLVLFAQFKPGAEWRPRRMAQPHGVLEMLRHTSGTRRDPGRILRTLTAALSKSVIIKSKRGEVGEGAKLILEFFEMNC